MAVNQKTEEANEWNKSTQEISQSDSDNEIDLSEYVIIQNDNIQEKILTEQDFSVNMELISVNLNYLDEFSYNVSNKKIMKSSQIIISRLNQISIFKYI